MILIGFGTTVEAAKLQLLDQMRYFSNEMYSAGWLDDLEFILWAEVLGFRETGATRFPYVAGVIKLVSMLAGEVNGWWRYSYGEPGATTEYEFMDMPTWEARFKAHPRYGVSL